MSAKHMLLLPHVLCVGCFIMRGRSVLSQKVNMRIRLMALHWVRCPCVASVALYQTICTCALRTYTYMYMLYMAYRTLDSRYTLPYIPIHVLHDTKLQRLFTISSHHLAC